MDAKEKAMNSNGEINLPEKTSANVIEDVVVQIANEQTPNYAEGPAFQGSSPLRRVSIESNTGTPRSVPVSCPSPEMSAFNPTANKPPRTPNATLTQRKSLRRSLYLGPKSRFGEQPQPFDDCILEEKSDEMFGGHCGLNLPYRSSFDRASPNNRSASAMRTMPTTPKTPLMASPGGIDDFEEIFKKVELSREKQKRFGVKFFIQWAAFVPYRVT